MSFQIHTLTHTRTRARAHAYLEDRDTRAPPSHSVRGFAWSRWSKMSSSGWILAVCLVVLEGKSHVFGIHLERMREPCAV